MRPKYSAAWKKLLVASVLRPFETKEYVCNIESASRRQSEEDEATGAVASARSAAKAILISVNDNINHPQGPHLTSATRKQMMATAKSKFEAAEEALLSIKRRNDLVTEFKQSVGNYLISEKEVEQHRIRVQWALEQVSLIEAELKESGITKINLDSIRDIKRRPGSDKSDDALDDRVIKKQRRDAGTTGSRPNRSRGPDGQRVKLKHNRNDAVDSGPPSNWPKCSGEDLDSTPGRKEGPNYQKANIRRNHDDSLNNGPPVTRLACRGEDLELSCETRDGIGAGLARDTHNFVTDEVGRSDGVERAARTIARPYSEIMEPTSDRLQRRKSTRSARQPLQHSRPLRRSARVAARLSIGAKDG